MDFDEAEWADWLRAIPRGAPFATSPDGTAWTVARDWRVIVKHAKGTPASTGRHVLLTASERSLAATVWDTESDDEAVLRGRCQFASALDAIGHGAGVNLTGKASAANVAEAFAARHATAYFTPDRMLNVVPEKVP